MVAGPSVMGTLLVMMLGGGFFGGGVMGLPPGERDSALVQCPPKDVILYSEWSARGKGKPGAPGIDGLAADPEILAFIAAIDKGIADTIAMNAGEGEEKVLGDNIPPLVKLLLNRPGCLYVDVDAKAAMQLMASPPELPPFTPPFFGMLPAVQVTLVVGGGDKADDIAQHLEAILQVVFDAFSDGQRVENLQHQKFPIPMEGASLTLHRHKDYFILGWGKETVDAAVKGLNGESQGLKDNPRVAAGMEKVHLERTASVAWFDLKSLVDKAVKGLGPQGLVVAAVVQQLGAESIESLAMCSGVEGGQLHTKGFLKTGGTTEGLLALAAGRPLKAEDFEAVPGDADLVFAFTIDLPKILSTTRKLVAQAGEQPKENFEQVLSQLEKELGLSFEDDLFKAFGQAWVLYDSPANGGVLMTAPVLGLEVIDQEAAKVSFEKLMAVLKLAVPGEIQAGRFGRGIYLNKKSFLDHDIYYINPVGMDQPFAPAFALTKTHLLAAPHPQQLKAHLRALESKDDRFSAKFQEKIPHAGGELFAACYSEPQLFARYFTSISPIMSTMMFGQIQRGTPGFDGFEFPSARAILPYVGTGLLTKERTEDGILVNIRHGIPIPGLSSLTGFMPLVGWWSFLARDVEMRAAPAIQINQHVPKRPVEKIQVRKIPRASAS
jgi:hypothetical protein